MAVGFKERKARLSLMAFQMGVSFKRVAIATPT